MQNRFNLSTLERASDGLRVGERALDEHHAVGNGTTVPSRKVVEDRDLVPGLDETLDRDGTDIAGAASDQNAHRHRIRVSSGASAPGRSGQFRRPIIFRIRDHSERRVATSGLEPAPGPPAAGT